MRSKLLWQHRAQIGSLTTWSVPWGPALPTHCSQQPLSDQLPLGLAKSRAEPNSQWAHLGLGSCWHRNRLHSPISMPDFPSLLNDFQDVVITVEGDMLERTGALKA